MLISPRVRVGSRIRELRRTREQTISELAQSAGLSTSLVSQVERDRISPSLTTLAAVAGALGVSMSSLFREDEPVYVWRAESLKRESPASAGHSTGSHGLRLAATVLAPGQTHAFDGNENDAVGIVLQGSVALDCGTGVEQLGPKDAFVLRRHGQGSLHNPGAASAEIYWVLPDPAS